MLRAAAVSAAGAMALSFGATGLAWADPATPAGGTAYAIGKCYDASQPPEVRPSRFAYNCDETGVMDDMAWSSWDANGAQGTGNDIAVECQPNCAQGKRLTNPIVVRAWNPLPPSTVGCLPGVEFYSDMTIAYPKGVPPWIKPGTTWDDGTDFVTVDGMPAVHYSALAPRCAPTVQR